MLSQTKIYSVFCNIMCGVVVKMNNDDEEKKKYAESQVSMRSKSATKHSLCNNAYGKNACEFDYRDPERLNNTTIFIKDYEMNNDIQHIRHGCKAKERCITSFSELLALGKMFFFLNWHHHQMLVLN